MMLLIMLLAGCASRAPSSCDVDEGLIVDLPGVQRPAEPVTNRKIITAIRDANDQTEADNSRKAQLRRQLAKCGGES